MASTLTKIYIHVIFHVKTTGLNMRASDTPRIFSYISGIVNNLGGVSIAVGGMPDHVHLLASMPKTLATSEFVRNIKTASCKFIKSLGDRYCDYCDYYDKFAWQDGYGAFSVSPSVLPQTKRYVETQQEHHKKISFEEEYRTLLRAYEVEYDESYAFSD